MKKILVLLVSTSLLTACFKKDVLDADRTVNFRETDFYANGFSDFTVTVDNFFTFDPQVSPNNPLDTTYGYGCTYTVPRDYYNAIREVWNDDLVVMTSSGPENLLRDDQLTFTDTIADRARTGEVLNLVFELELRSGKGLMARTTSNSNRVVVNR